MLSTAAKNVGLGGFVCVCLNSTAAVCLHYIFRLILNWYIVSRVLKGASLFRSAEVRSIHTVVKKWTQSGLIASLLIASYTVLTVLAINLETQ